MRHIMQNTYIRQLLRVGLIVVLCIILCSCGGETATGEAGEAKLTMKSCWLCSIYSTVFLQASEVVFGATNATIPVAKTVLGIGLLFFFLFRVGGLMMFTSEKDMIKIMKDSMFVLLKAIFVAALIYNGDTFLHFLRDFVIYPLGSFFLMLANAVLDAIPGSGIYFGGIEGITPDMKGFVVDGKIENLNWDRSVFGDIGIQVQYTVARIFAGLNSGFIFVKHIFNDGGFWNWLFGLVALWELFNVVIIFPLAFVDAFVVLSFYIVFLPICLALWVFPGMDKYIKAIVPKQIISPFLDILFGCIVAVLMVMLLQVYSNISMGGVFLNTVGDRNSGVAKSAAGARPRMLVFVALLICVRKISSEIADFSEIFGGRRNSSSLFKLADRIKEILKSIVVTGVKMAIAGPATAGTVGLKALGKGLVSGATSFGSALANSNSSRNEEGRNEEEEENP